MPGISDQPDRYKRTKTMSSRRSKRIKTPKDLIMIASPLSHQKASAGNAPHVFLKYVPKRSLAVVMFITFMLLASLGNKSSEKITPNQSVKQSSGDGRYLSLNPRHLFENIARSVKDAFNDPALLEYANEQGADIPESLTTPCPNTSQPISVRSKSVSGQSSKPSSTY